MNIEPHSKTLKNVRASIETFKDSVLPANVIMTNLPQEIKERLQILYVLELSALANDYANELMYKRAEKAKDTERMQSIKMVRALLEERRERNINDAEFTVIDAILTSMKL